MGQEMKYIAPNELRKIADEIENNKCVVDETYNKAIQVIQEMYEASRRSESQKFLLMHIESYKQIYQNCKLLLETYCKYIRDNAEKYEMTEGPGTNKHPLEKYI